MNTDSLHNARSLVRDVIIPICGVAVIVVQLFLPGERLGLIAAGLSMMGLPFVAYGARKLDEQTAKVEADK
jgi:hypothetical protein